jgi:predicted DNA-binding ribbon-helix-helix protein
MVRSTESRNKSRADCYPISGNLVVDGRRTCVRLEAEMWAALKEVANHEDCTVNDLASRINRRKKDGQNFTSAIRVYLMLYYRKARK